MYFAMIIPLEFSEIFISFGIGGFFLFLRIQEQF